MAARPDDVDEGTPEPRAPKEQATPPPEAEPMGTESPTIFEGAVEVGTLRLGNTSRLMAMNGFIAGLYVTFSGLGAMTFLGTLEPALGFDAAWLVAAALYPVGFIFVILGKSELFTENFLTPVLAAWEMRGAARALVKLWAITLAANLVGVLLAAAAWAHPALDLLPDASRAAFVAVATEDLARPHVTTLAKGVVGGVLINFMSWLVIAARGALTKLVMMFLPTYLIMSLRAVHSVVGSFEVLVGIMSGAPGGYVDWLGSFLLPAIVGNMLGGILFVSALHYAQAREGRRVLDRRGGGRST